MTNALMLGGGAPTLTLQSGALAALDKQGIEFDVISTAGAGMVIGLLYAAPKGGDRQAALANTREMGVHDSIYEHFPVNYKVFHKPGPMADAYRRMLHSLPRVMPGQDDLTRLWSDWMALMFATWCPSDLSASSGGLCDHAPWIDDIVDFDQLKAFPGDFYMNAYCLNTHKMEIFSKEQITPDHFRAALAFPLIYPPFKVGNKTYIEGSAIDTLCFRGLLDYRKRRETRDKRIAEGDDDLKPLEPIKNIVVFDILSAKEIIREPKTLYDAWIQSIMVPLVEIAKNDLRMFEQTHLKKWEGVNLHKIPFKLTAKQWEHALDWSYSNLSELYDVGYQSGLQFYEKHKDHLEANPATKKRKRAA